MKTNSSHFLRHMEATAHELGAPAYPVDNAIWRAAAKSFTMMDIFA